MSVATDPLYDKADIRRMYDYFLTRKQYRNYLLIVALIYVFPRISDILQFQVKHVYNVTTDTFVSHISYIEGKNHKPKKVALHPFLKEAFELYFSTQKNLQPDDFIFKSRKGVKSPYGRPICREQAWKIIKKSAQDLGVYGVIACHSMRKTLPHHAFNDRIADIYTLMEMLNHNDIESTRRYLCITQSLKDKVVLSVKL